LYINSQISLQGNQSISLSIYLSIYLSFFLTIFPHTKAAAPQALSQIFLSFFFSHFHAEAAKAQTSCFSRLLPISITEAVKKLSQKSFFSFYFPFPISITAAAAAATAKNNPYEIFLLQSKAKQSSKTNAVFFFVFFFLGTAPQASYCCCSYCHEKLMNSCCNRIPAASSVATGYLTYLLTTAK
jgi:hypothetical protein